MNPIYDFVHLLYVYLFIYLFIIIFAWLGLSGGLVPSNCLPNIWHVFLTDLMRATYSANITHLLASRLFAEAVLNKVGQIPNSYAVWFFTLVTSEFSHQTLVKHSILWSVRVGFEVLFVPRDVLGTVPCGPSRISFVLCEELHLPDMETDIRTVETHVDRKTH